MMGTARVTGYMGWSGLPCTWTTRVAGTLFHHSISTFTESMKFQAVNMFFSARNKFCAVNDPVYCNYESSP